MLSLITYNRCQLIYDLSMTAYIWFGQKFGLQALMTFGPSLPLLFVPSVIICVARTGPYLRSTIIGPILAFLFGQIFGLSAFMSFALSHPCCTIIGSVIALLQVSLGIIPVASTGIYLHSTIIRQIVPVPTVTSWLMLGYIFVSHLYLSTWVPLTLQ